MPFKFSDAPDVIFVGETNSSGAQPVSNSVVSVLEQTADRGLRAINGFVKTIESTIVEASKHIEEIEVEFSVKFEPEIKTFGIKLGPGSADFKVKVKFKPATPDA